MWVAAVICFIAFGIECAKGEIASYDNVGILNSMFFIPKFYIYVVKNLTEVKFDVYFLLICVNVNV